MEDEDYLLRPNVNHQRRMNALDDDSEEELVSESGDSGEENDGVETVTDALGNTVIKT